MRVAVLMLVFLATRSAFATGLCENAGPRYDAPELAFVELRDIHDHAIGRLATAQGEDAAHLRATIGDFEAIAYGKLHVTLLTRGYKPIAAPKTCKLTTAWTDVASGGGWRGAVVQLAARRRPGVLLTF
jgi:hypothetical protein